MAMLRPECRRGAVAATVLMVAASAGLLVATPLAAAASGRRPTAAEARICATAHRSSWMGCLVRADPGFGETPLSEVAIPGSHDSGTFNLDPTDFDTQSGSSCTSYIPLFSSLPALVARWSQTQDESFTQQLNHGIRYFDLRVAYPGDPAQGWRIVHTQFARSSLSDDLDQIASWASQHPREVVIVDLNHVCYDNHPTPAEADSLWSSFTTPANAGSDRSTLAGVAFDARTPGSRPLATVSVDQVVDERGGGHNVVVLVPKTVEDAAGAAVAGLHPGFTVAGSVSTAKGGSAVPVEYAWPEAVSPAPGSDFSAANMALEQYPRHISVRLGSLRDRGFYQSQLIYSLSGSSLSGELAQFRAFGGLLAANTLEGIGTAPSSVQPPWEEDLWTAGFNRNEAIEQWGVRANIVVSDGVEHDGYIQTVIEQNAR